MEWQSHNKFREPLLYVAHKSERDPSFGATKLNKLLFIADFLSYAKAGKSITGQPYVKLKNGPAPKNQRSWAGEPREPYHLL